MKLDLLGAKRFKRLESAKRFCVFFFHENLSHQSAFDHSIFLESIDFIKDKLGETGLTPLQQDVLERLIHTSGDFGVQDLLKFTPNACECGIRSIKKGSLSIIDTDSSL